jgi:hypothetical protein
MMTQSCRRAWLPTATRIAMSTKYCDILVDIALIVYDRLSRRTERVVAGFGGRRLIEAVLGMYMLVVQDRVS